jgi:hypothetical protein
MTEMPLCFGAIYAVCLLVTWGHSIGVKRTGRLVNGLVIWLF